MANWHKSYMKKASETISYAMFLAENVTRGSAANYRFYYIRPAGRSWHGLFFSFFDDSITLLAHFRVLVVGWCKNLRTYCMEKHITSGNLVSLAPNVAWACVCIITNSPLADEKMCVVFARGLA